MQEATRNAESEVAGVMAQIEAEKQRIEMVKGAVPGQHDRACPGRPAEDGSRKPRPRPPAIRGQAQAELEQLTHTIAILQEGGSQGLTAYTIEKFGGLVDAFAGTMNLFPVQHISVIAGRREAGRPDLGHPPQRD